MNINEAIHKYVEAHNYLLNICPNPAELPKDKQYFYNKVLELIEAGQTLIKAQSEKITWLEQSALINKEEDKKIRQQQLFNIIQLAKARGVDIDLIRFID